MRIQEFQAKQLLAAHGIPIPPGRVAASADEARRAGEQTGGGKWMVKAQIYAGGRGLGAFKDGLGGVRAAGTLDEIAHHATAMLGKTLVTTQTGAEGLPVERVYIEQALAVERELALSLLVDERNRCLKLLLFERGGVGMEQAAAHAPDSVHSIAVDSMNSAAQLDASVAKLGEQLDLTAALQNQLKEISTQAIRLLREKDASFIEINPLAVCDGQLVALDAKMIFDKNALFRQPDILAMEQDLNRGHRLASVHGFNYLPLDGDIACLAVGAGLCMATLDAIRHYGGQAANFLDLPPDSKVNRVVSALELLLANRRANSLLINVFGGGIMRCDTMADAILLVNHSQPIRLPLTARLSGTNSELANRRLKESIPGIFLAANLAQAAEAAVAAGAGKRPQAGNWITRLLRRG